MLLGARPTPHLHSAGAVPEVNAILRPNQRMSCALVAFTLAGGATAQTADVEAESAAELWSSARHSTDEVLAEVQELELAIYGFTDFTYTHRLNDFAFASPYPSFMVGNLNL